MTLAGLNTVNLSQINTFQQFILFLLIMLGSAILVSIVVVHARRKAFDRKFKSILEQKQWKGRFMRRMSFSKSRTREAPGENRAAIRGTAIKVEESSEENTNGLPESHKSTDLAPSIANGNGGNGAILGPANAEKQGTTEPTAGQPLTIDTGMSRRITFASTTSPTRHRGHNPLFPMQGVGARGDLLNHPKRSMSNSLDLPRSSEHEPSAPEADPHAPFAFLSGALIGRNSRFSNLTLAEREKLGGVEYRAVSILAVVVPVYFVLWQLLGCIGLGAYIANIRPDTAAANAENPW